MTRAIVFSSLITLSLVAGHGPARAEGKLAQLPQRMYRAGLLQVKRGLYNIRQDRDARMTTAEFRQYKQTGTLPGRVQPASVLQTKLDRADRYVKQLKANASLAHKLARVNSPGGPELKVYAMGQLDGAVVHLRDARRYADKAGLPEPPAARSLARQAVRGLRSLVQAEGTPGLRYVVMAVGGEPSAWRIMQHHDNQRYVESLAGMKITSSPARNP